MLLIDECKLQNQTIELIGLNYGIRQEKEEDYFDYIERIVQALQHKKILIENIKKRPCFV